MTLSPEEAARVYDRIGRLQDSQAFYEDAAIDRMITLADFPHAGSVFELGCGTGRLARRLLAGHLPPDAKYLATDVSTRMVHIAEGRLSPWASRASVVALEPAARGLPGQTGAFDRFVATYVFDLLDNGDARRLLDEAARLLDSDGRLCVVGITPGPKGMTRWVMRGWGVIAKRLPRLVGGCRPIDLRGLLDPERWNLEASEVVTRWAASSQVVVAEPRDCGHTRVPAG